MSSQTLRPKWWQLYLVLPLLLTLFIVEHRLSVSTLGHQVVQIGIVLLIYGFIQRWLNANRRAFSQMDREQNDGRITVVRMPFMQIPASSNGSRLTFQLPDSEIKGVLSDTFERDFSDGISFPIDEVSHESKNESANLH